MGKKVFVAVSVAMWLVIILFSFYILKTGGHLKPKAAGIESFGDDVNGRVEFSGVGIVGAKITVFANGNNNYTYTDSGGNFKLEKLSGTYYLLVEKAGYRSVEIKFNTQDRKFQNISLVK